MYQILCDDHILYDHRDDRLRVLNPKCKLEVNTVGEASFTILSDHPYYASLKRQRSIFEIRQDGDPIFRGRMTTNSQDFNNQLSVDLEGVLSFTCDSIIHPFDFPNGFPIYPSNTNTVENFLALILEEHNSQVEDWQKLKLGTVTVTAHNNSLFRSSEKFLSTWEVLKTKLFDSDLGGYLCIRYESDGNYVDYLKEFPLTNNQTIVFGENLLDIVNESTMSETYSAICPTGKDGITIEQLADGVVSPGIVKKGAFVYSESAKSTVGWVCVPTTESVWEDVTEPGNLLDRAVDHLTAKGMQFTNTITVKAVDLHFTDSQIQSFRIYRNVKVNSTAHGIEDATFPLLKLDIDILNPQNTTITVGRTSRSLSGLTIDQTSVFDKLIQHFKNVILQNVTSQVIGLADGIDGLDGVRFHIRFSKYADGHMMTNVPSADSEYIGVYHGTDLAAPNDYTAYTWYEFPSVNGFPGPTGEDGKTQYLHIRFSNDGENFTADSGLEVGSWIGTLVDYSEFDSPTFNEYTWDKITADIKVGGRNLLQKSDPIEWGLDHWGGMCLFVLQEDGWLSVGRAATAPWDDPMPYGSYPPLTSSFPYAGEYVLSFDAYSTEPMVLDYNHIMTESENNPIGQVAIGTEPKRYIIPFTLDEGLDMCSVMIGSTQGDQFFIRDIQVEYGNIATMWMPAPEDGKTSMGILAGDLHQTILEQSTVVLNDAEKVFMAALERYVETSNYDEFRKTVSNELELLADRLTLTFTSVTEQITNINGDLQTIAEQLIKHFEFTADGLKISAGDGSMQLVIDNDIIRFTKNGQEFGWWDGVDFHTGNIIVDVNERAQFGNFAFVPRSNGSLSFLKVR